MPAIQLGPPPQPPLQGRTIVGPALAGIGNVASFPVGTGALMSDFDVVAHKLVRVHAELLIGGLPPAGDYSSVLLYLQGSETKTIVLLGAVALDADHSHSAADWQWSPPLDLSTVFPDDTSWGLWSYGTNSGASLSGTWWAEVVGAA